LNLSTRWFASQLTYEAAFTYFRGMRRPETRGLPVEAFEAPADSGTMAKMKDDYFNAKLAFEELTPKERIAVLDALLAVLSADQVRVAINDTECLGLVAEARLIRLERPDELARYLPASEVRRLGALVSEALVARLPRTI
jgi:hypothetical protein